MWRTPARLARGPRGEDDQRAVAGVEVGRLDRRLLGTVLVHRLVDLGERHRFDPVRQLCQQLVLADRERRVGDAGAQLQVVAAQLGIAGQRDRAHAPAGEHRQHPLDPVADQDHHGVAAPHAAGREGAGEPGADRDQLAEMPDPQLALAIERDHRSGRGGEALQHFFDEVHGAKSAAGGREPAINCDKDEKCLVELATCRFVPVTIPLYYEGHAYRAGSRIRVTISAPNGDQPIWSFSETDPNGQANVAIAFSRQMPSSLVLPVVPGVNVPTGLPPCPGLRGEPCRDYQPVVNHQATR